MKKSVKKSTTKQPVKTEKKSTTKKPDTAFKNYVKFVKKNFWIRVGAGKFGAGLIAVQDIPKGTRIVAGHPPGTYIPAPGKKEYNKVKNRVFTVKDFADAGLTKEQISLMQDFVCRGSNRNAVPIPFVYDMLFPPMYQFGNHSDNPNVEVQGYHLVALRKIKKNEELFHDYRQTCSPNEIIF